MGSPLPATRHLLRAKDLADARYHEGIGVPDMARAAGLSRAHFSREFRRAFGDPPRRYLLTRRLERAAGLLRKTDHSVTEICFSVGLTSVASFTNSFTRSYGVSPSAYREQFPNPRAMAVVPACVVHAYARPPREAPAGSVPLVGGPMPAKSARFDKSASPGPSSLREHTSTKEKP